MMEKAGGGKNSMKFGKSNAKVYVQSSDGIKFEDVEGVDEAKESLQEIVVVMKILLRLVPNGSPSTKGEILESGMEILIML